MMQEIIHAEWDRYCQCTPCQLLQRFVDRYITLIDACIFDKKFTCGFFCPLTFFYDAKNYIDIPEELGTMAKLIKPKTKGSENRWLASDISAMKTKEAKAKITSEPRIQKFNDRDAYVVELTVGKDAKELVLNATNFDALVEAFGDDSEDWIGKTTTMYLVRVQNPQTKKEVDSIRLK